MVNDPDSVLDSLTREVIEVGPDGQEVVVFIDIKIFIYSNVGMDIHNWLFCR